jgi:hypothetical protein
MRSIHTFYETESIKTDFELHPVRNSIAKELSDRRGAHRPVDHDRVGTGSGRSQEPQCDRCQEQVPWAHGGEPYKVEAPTQDRRCLNER